MYIKNNVIFYILLLIVFNNACMNTKKLSNIIDNEILSLSKTKIELDSFNIYLSISKKDTLTDLYNIVQTKKEIIPAIFYWHTQKDFNISLSDSLIKNMLQQHLYFYLDSFKLNKSNLSIQLLVHIDSIPAQFQYNTNKHVAVFLFYAFVQQLQNIQADSAISNVHSFLFNKDGTAIYKQQSYHFATSVSVKKSQLSTKNYLHYYFSLYNNQLKLYAKSIIESLYIKENEE
jgi:hypothetical protein